MKEFDFGYAIVKIHPGKLSDDERKKAIEEAAKRFYIAVEKSKKECGK